MANRPNGEQRSPVRFFTLLVALVLALSGISIGPALASSGPVTSATKRVDSISPTSGLTTGGTAVTIRGSGLTGTTSVSFGGVAAPTMSVVDDTTITATTPAHTAGAVDVVVATTAGNITLVSGFEYRIRIFWVTPNNGPVGGGTPVSLYGAALTGTTGVTFGGVAATGVSVVNDTTVTAIAPAHAAGTVNVAVTTNLGTGTLLNGFTYGARADSITPSTGSRFGGTAITITGTRLTGTTSVTFGGAPASAVSVISDTTVTATTPAHAFGLVDVGVSGPNGTSTVTNGYEYAATVPTVDWVDPNAGSAGGGIPVTINGSAFTGATNVTFGGAAATSVDVVGDGTITAVTPAHVAGAVDVSVTTPDGTGTLAGGYQFGTRVDAITPGTGSPAGGTPVMISGVGFLGATAVTFGGVSASGLSVVDDTTIMATAPSHAAGTVNV
ncbi:MAG: IPT/TIG domain-containing protein, partial [Actinomycetes bacterium]